MEHTGNTSSSKKEAMTDEERLALAAKLDRDLDDFIANLKKREQPEGPPDENWLEEFDSHPFFMKKMPEAGDALHPLYEGLQQLKYDPNENTPEELATSYKEDGNFNFKHKNYRLAIIAYTEGIKAKCNDNELQASLYNNRSAAHWFLQNYRSSLRDAQWALKFRPNYDKAMSRAAQCCFHMEKYDEAIKYCDSLLEIKKSTEILDLWKKCIACKKECEKNARKRQIALKKKELTEIKLLEAIKSRGIKLQGDLSLNNLQPQLPELSEHCVHLEEEKLVWPVLIVYPEFRTMDFIQQFSEESTLLDHLQVVLGEKPEWDIHGEYKVNNIEVYYEYADKRRVKRVPLAQKLIDVMKETTFVLKNGTPCFIILVSGSEAEEEFLSSY